MRMVMCGSRRPTISDVQLKLHIRTFACRLFGWSCAAPGGQLAQLGPPAAELSAAVAQLTTTIQHGGYTVTVGAAAANSLLADVIHFMRHGPMRKRNSEFLSKPLWSWKKSLKRIACKEC